MINILLSRAEALLIVELLNKSHDSLIQSLIISVEDENDKDQVARAAKENYVANLEMEVKRLEAQLKAPSVTASSYGLKKDGTPKAKPGRKSINRKTKGTK